PLTTARPETQIGPGLVLAKGPRMTRIGISHLPLPPRPCLNQTAPRTAISDATAGSDNVHGESLFPEAFGPEEYVRNPTVGAPGRKPWRDPARCSPGNSSPAFCMAVAFRIQWAGERTRAERERK